LIRVNKMEVVGGTTQRIGGIGLYRMLGLCKQESRQKQQQQNLIFHIQI